MKWIWIRHGETEANARAAYLGHTDSPLTAQGILQAERAADKLRDRGVQFIRWYSSDLTRCMHTARIIERRLELSTQPIRVFDLRELHFGDWEGMNYDEIMQQDADRARRWYDDIYNVSPPGGESLLELGRRIDRWVGQVLSEAAPSDTIGIVSHGGPIRWFMGHYVHGDASHFWQVDGIPHGGIVVVERQSDKWMITERI